MCIFRSKVVFSQRSSSAAQKNGVEFRQKFIGTVRCSLATSNDYWRRRSMSMKLTGTDRQADRQADGQTNLCIWRLRLRKFSSFFNKTIQDLNSIP